MLLTHRSRDARPPACFLSARRAACAAPGATGRKGRLARARPATRPCWPRPRIYRLKKDKNPTGSLRATGKPAVPQQLPPGIPTAGNSPSACGAAGGQGEWCRGGPTRPGVQGMGGPSHSGSSEGPGQILPGTQIRHVEPGPAVLRDPRYQPRCVLALLPLNLRRDPLWSPTQKCPSITGLRMARLAVWTLGGPGPL